MLNTILHNAQLIIVFAFVLLSLLGGIFRKMQEQREAQRRRAAAERARLEMLRTGRGATTTDPMLGTAPVFQPGPSAAPLGPPTSAAEALARLEEIARRRQEQMGRVRGGQQQQQQPPQRRVNELSGPVVVMGPSGPMVIRPGQPMGGPGGFGGAGGAPPQTGKKNKGRQQPQPQRQGKQGKQQARPAPVPEPAAPSSSFDLEQVRAAAANAPAVVTGRGGVALPNGAPRTPQEWRRLAAANAIFGRPVGEQQGLGDGGPGRLF